MKVAAIGIAGAYQLSNPVSFSIVDESTDGCNGSFVSGSIAYALPSRGPKCKGILIHK